MKLTALSTRMSFNRLAALAWAGLAGLAAARAAGVFHWHSVGHLSLCLFKSLTGIDCPGCGMLRGLVAALGGNFRDAYALHPLALPLLMLWTTWMVTGFWRPQTARQKSIVSTLSGLGLASILILYSHKLLA
jgi:hypothetical protein